MNLSLTNRTLVTGPVKASTIPSRYTWLSLDLAEPNLGIPEGPSTGTYVLTSSTMGARGWTNILTLSTLGAFTGVFSNVITNSLSSVNSVASNIGTFNILHTTTLSAVSAFIDIIDIKRFELSGYNITGDLSVTGFLSGNVKIIPPLTAVQIPNRYIESPLGALEPNLGVAPETPLITTLDFYVLTADKLGRRGYAASSKPYVYAGAENELSIVPALGNNTTGRFTSAFPFPIGSTIAGGENNKISYSISFIGTGSLNEIRGSDDTNVSDIKGYNFIGSGLSNRIFSSESATILNGRNNTISTLGDYNNILGGRLNDANGGNYNTILNGYSNSNRGSYSLMWGYNNTSSRSYNIIGGNNNISTADYATILNGIQNVAGRPLPQRPTSLSSIIIDSYNLGETNPEKIADSTRLLTQSISGVEKSYIAVGSPEYNTVRLFSFNKILNQAYLVATLSAEQTTSYFGYDIDIDGETRELYISAPLLNNKGGVFIYSIDPINDTFTLTDTISTNLVDDYSWYGHSIKGRAKNLLIGAPYHNLSSGIVHFYSRTDRNIKYSTTTPRTISGIQVGEQFGYALNSNIFQEKNSEQIGALIVTAPAHDSPTKQNVGTCYVFNISGIQSNFDLGFVTVLSATSYDDTVIDQNSQWGKTRFVRCIYNNEQFDGYCAFVVGIPYVSREFDTSFFSPPISGGGYFTIVLNEDLRYPQGLSRPSIRVTRVYKGTTTTFRSITASNLGYSIAKRDNISSRTALYGMPSLYSSNNEGAIVVYNGTDWITLYNESSSTEKFFGSSLDYLDDSHIVATSFDKITNQPFVKIYEYITTPVTTYSTILNGNSNNIKGTNTIIGTGSFNIVDTNANQVTVFGSNNNIGRDTYNIAVFGDNNTILPSLSDVTIIGTGLSGTKSDSITVKNIDILGSALITGQLFVTNLTALSTTFATTTISTLTGLTGLFVDGSIQATQAVSAKDIFVENIYSTGVSIFSTLQVDNLNIENISLTSINALSGYFDYVDVNSGTLDDVIIGGEKPNIGIFTTLSSNDFSFSGTLSATDLSLLAPVLSTFAKPLTATGEFILIKLGNNTRAIRLWDFTP